MAARVGRDGRTIYAKRHVSTNANKSRIFRYRTRSCRRPKSVVQKSIFLGVRLHLRFGAAGRGSWGCMIICGSICESLDRSRGNGGRGKRVAINRDPRHGWYSRFMRCVATSPYHFGKHELQITFIHMPQLNMCLLRIIPTLFPLARKKTTMPSSQSPPRPPPSPQR